VALAKGFVMSGVRVTLRHPITFDGTIHRALSLRAPEPDDLAAVRRPGDTALVSCLESGIALAARMAGVPEAVIYALDDHDAELVGETVKTLLGMA
jgi:Phage tail assembly chaperone proteins, E, or 41 or 14